MPAKTKRRLRETCVLYESSEDGCWIAHGLRTDQIGTGNCVVDALADFMKAIDQLLKIAAQGKNISVLRPAPPEVRAMAKSARPLPREIYEIAHKKLYGRWPREFCVAAPPKQTYKTTLSEPLPA
jgi:hypothetical protein